MFFAFVKDTIDHEWHRIDVDVQPTQRQALCGYRAQVASSEEAPWSEIWKRKLIEPSGARCAKCEDIASRLTDPIERLKVAPLRIVGPSDTVLTLDEDFARLLDEL